MYVIITCKYEKDQIKNSREKVETLFSHYKPMEIFSDVQGQRTPQSVVQLVPALMHVIVTCNFYEKERMKNSREKVETPFFPS